MLIQTNIVDFINDVIKCKNFHIHSVGDVIKVHWEDVTEGHNENYDIDVCVCIPKTEEELQKEYDEKIEYLGNPWDFIERYKVIKRFPFFRNCNLVLGNDRIWKYEEGDCRAKALDVVEFVLDEVLPKMQEAYGIA